MSDTDTIFTRNFVLLAAAYMLSMMGLNMQLPLLPLFIDSIGGSELDVGIVIGILGLFAIITRFPLGPYIDAHGRKLVFMLGIACFMASFWLCSFCTETWHLVMVRMLSGVGLASLVLGGVAMVVDSSPKGRLGEVLGYYTGIGISSMVFGPALSGIILDTAGFDASFWVSSLLCLAALMFALGVREKFHVREGIEMRFRDVMRNNNLITASIVGLFLALCFVTVGSFFPLLATSQGLSASEIGLFFSIYGIAIIASRPVFGKLSDRVGRVTLLVPLMLFAALTFVLFSAVTAPWQYFSLAVLFGISMGPAMPISSALAVDTISPGQRGKAIALHANSFDAGVMVGPVTMGIVAQQFGFNILFPVLAVLMVTGLGLALLNVKFGGRGLRK